jgi:hypothetical protein
MLKRSCIALSVGLLAVAGVWLLRGSDEAVKPREVAKAVQSPEAAGAGEEAIPEASLPEEEVPRSQRHAAGEIEKHRAVEMRLKEIKKAVRDQEERVENDRKILARIVRSKGIIYKGTDSVVPPEPTPETGATPEEKAALQEALNKKEAEERGRDAQDYVDAKRDLEISQELLRQMQLKLDEERARLKAEEN